MTEWKEIDTAPRDGTAILAANSRHHFNAPVVVRWNRDCEVDECPGWVDAATHLGTALYFNPNYFDYWAEVPMLPLSLGESADKEKAK